MAHDPPLLVLGEIIKLLLPFGILFVHDDSLLTDFLGQKLFEDLLAIEFVRKEDGFFKFNQELVKLHEGLLEASAEVHSFQGSLHIVELPDSSHHTRLHFLE